MKIIFIDHPPAGPLRLLRANRTERTQNVQRDFFSRFFFFIFFTALIFSTEITSHAKRVTKITIRILYLRKGKTFTGDVHGRSSRNCGKQY